MPKQSGIIQLRGTINNVTFLQTKYGFIARAKSRFSKQQWLNSSGYLRGRENAQEFTTSARAGYNLRAAVKILTQRSSDKQLHIRAHSLMSEIKNLDFVSKRGKRNPAAALNTAEGLAMLNGFEFNSNSNVPNLLFSPYSVDLTSGEIIIPDLLARNMVRFPEGATHVEFLGAWANVDLETGAFDLQISNQTVLSYADPVQTVTLLPAGAPSGTGISVYLLQMTFTQEVNGELYPLSNGKYNALRIVDVAV